MRNPIIVALDLPTGRAALDLATRLAPHVGAVKVGKELFTAAGPEVVRALRAAGLEVFLDLKFHDIPNTVAGAVRSAVALDVRMLTVHAGGGSAMLRAAESAARTAAAERGTEPPLVLGVTVLTSMDADALREVGVAAEPAAQVQRLAALAVDAGLRGLVCSPQELSWLRRVLPAGVQLVTPGIRPANAAADDQKRVMTPEAAREQGADWLVIGRPITAAPDPVAAARAISQSLR
ncbi:MAG: orotidine-5'-phosphate decarboxylase [Verrucomicrobiales bacterium]|nr:orotidine-5'-phosphate decarboxylase [Verrucomicrobiales bacterium]